MVVRADRRDRGLVCSLGRPPDDSATLDVVAWAERPPLELVERRPRRVERILLGSRNRERWHVLCEAPCHA
jgi:hypothetical protein